MKSICSSAHTKPLISTPSIQDPSAASLGEEVHINCETYQTINDIETLEWSRTIVSDAASVEVQQGKPAGLIVADAAVIQDFKDRQTWLDKREYQREDHIEACQYLNIKNPDRPQEFWTRNLTQPCRWQGHGRPPSTRGPRCGVPAAHKKTHCNCSLSGILQSWSFPGRP
jgi:hypothetical protein